MPLGNRPLPSYINYNSQHGVDEPACFLLIAIIATSYINAPFVHLYMP